MNAALQKSEIFLLVVLAVVVGVFAYTIQSVLSPILLFIVILFLAFPLRSRAVVKTLTTVVVLLFFVWFFDTLSSALAPAIIAALLAYILNPVVDLLMRRKLPRPAATSIIMLAFIAVVVTSMFLLVPAVVNSFKGFNPQQLADEINEWIYTVVIPWLVSFGIQESDIQNILSSKVLPHIESILRSVVGSVANIALGVTSLLGQLANAVIIPILMFYILLDYDKIKRWMKKLFPIARREQASLYFKKIDAVLAAYLRGAITIAIINAVIVTTFFSIFGIPFAVVLGILSGLLTLIPQFGVFITIAISAVVSLFGPSPGVHIVIVLIVLVGENLFESSILYPKIVGEALGLHPAALIISLLIFAYFLGFIGMLIAVPVTSLLARFLEEYIERRDTIGGARELE